MMTQRKFGSRQICGLTLVASAASLASSDAVACGGGYSGYACDEGGVAICSVIGGAPYPDWVCDLTQNGDSTAATLTVVYSTSTCGTNNEYCAWGTDASGVNFCCALDVDLEPIERIVAMGGTHADGIRWINTTEHLESWTTAEFTGVVYTRQGGGDADTIPEFPNGGSDWMEAGAGDDDAYADEVFHQTGYHKAMETGSDISPGVYDPELCEECLEAASNGSSDSWGGYCKKLPESERRECRSHTLESPTNKKNYCYNDVCDK